MEILKPLVISLLGPTASGKTELAIEIAEKLNLNIHNIDSRQIYIGMDIGTAKPTKDQQKRVQHHLLDLYQPNQKVTVQAFKEKAISSLNEYLKGKNMGFLVGGSGLYLKAITEGLRPPAVPPQDNLRMQLSEINQYECHKMLKSCDPDSAEKISPSDSMRTIRALEVFYATGKKISSLKSKNPPPWKVLEIGLNPCNLHSRIAKRTKNIYSNGLLEETEHLIKKFGKDLPILHTIGYQEALLVIQGKIKSDEAIQKTTIRTNQFAKKQKTWFRKQHNPKWLIGDEPIREALSLIHDNLV